MDNLITKYKEFLFEEDSSKTQISSIKLEISKLEDQLKMAKNKMLDSKKTSTNESSETQAEAVYVASQAEIYGKMVPLLNNLKTQLDKRSAELKG